MSRSVTVSFEDGTSHVYEDVPDNVNDAQVEQRASSEFENKGAAKIATPAAAPHEASMGEKAMGVVQTGAQVLAPAAELYAGKKLVLDPALEAIKNRGTPGPVSPAQAAQAAGQQAQNYRVAGTGTSPINYNVPTTTPNPNLKLVQGGPAVPESMPAAPQAAPKMPGVMSSAQSIVQKLALDKVLKNAGPIAAGMQVAQGLFGTSPEEIAKMKEAEARKRAQGWKPMNER